MILFQKKDSKFVNLKTALDSLGIVSKALPGSPVYAPFYVIKNFLKGGIKIYTFRYLNDYRSLPMTILRAMSELCTLLICKALGVRVWWLCHNVNKESIEYFPRITSIRRKFVAKCAVRILTTDKLLEKYARKAFTHNNVSSISFGYIKGEVYDDLAKNIELEKEIHTWLSEKKRKNACIIYCAGTPVNKALHFKLINRLILSLNSNETGQYYCALVVGDKVEESEDIFNIPFRYSVNQDLIREFVDCYYRVIDDLSVSYTVYEAAYLGKPVVTENYGFLPELVKGYNIGVVLPDEEIVDLNYIIKERGFELDSFLEKNNWLEAAKVCARLYWKDINYT